MAKAGDRSSACERALDMVQLGAVRQPPPGADVGRPAAAGGPGPGAGVRAQARPDGRAAGSARQAAAREHAIRDQAPARAARRDRGLRHPRPGRGADHVGPDRGVQRGPRSSSSPTPAAALRATRPTRSSPSSSARTTGCSARSSGSTASAARSRSDGALVQALAVNIAGPGSATTLSLRPERVVLDQCRNGYPNASPAGSRS